MRMLQDLPLELLVHISSYLTLSQKVQCRQVCRRWAKVIKDSCFLEFVQLNQQEDYFGLIDLVEEEELHGTQVKTLISNDCGLAPIDIFTLADLFPNIKEFEWNDKEESLFPELTINDHENITRWGKSLKSITIRTPYSFTAHLLQTSTFSRLEQLTVSFVASHDEIGKVELLQSLKHAPVLQTIELDCVSLTVEDMELLHNNTPALTSLKLRRTGLLPMLRRDFAPVLDEETSQFRFDLKPALKVRSFQFTDSSSFCDHESYWLKYISEKYTDLDTLSIDCELPEVRVIFIADNFDFADTFHDGLLKLVSRCRKLKVFNVNQVSLTSPIYDVLDDNQTQLEEITINQYDDHKPLDQALDVSKWHTRCQKLKRLNIYHCQQQPFSTKSQLFPQLTHLTITYTADLMYEVLNLDELLFCLPVLNTLEVTDHCILDAKNTTPSLDSIMPYKLQILTISNCTFSRNLLSFINNCCYLLSRLSFIKAVPLWISPFEINLPDVQLNTLRLSFHQPLKVESCTENKCCLELLPKLKESLLGSTSHPEKISLISIQCKRIQHLSLNGIDRY